VRVHVLYFARLKDVMGTDGETLDLDAGARARDVLRVLETRPEWSGVKDLPLLLAVNEEVVDGNRALNDGDRLALLPPVSGG
jgi:molybdopterin converting factor subunit 1